MVVELADELLKELAVKVVVVPVELAVVDVLVVMVVDDPDELVLVELTEVLDLDELVPDDDVTDTVEPVVVVVVVVAMQLGSRWLC